MNQKKDIMDQILGAKDEELSSDTRELDCLIYRSDGTGGTPDTDMAKQHTGKSWKVTKEDVSVEVWESKAKIKFRVASGKYKSMSIKKIASIAVDAILNELKREDRE